MTATFVRPATIPRLPKVWPQEHFDALLSQDRPASVPLEGLNHLQIEMTNHCDLQCVECPQRLMNRYRQWMMPDVFEAILTRLLMRYEFETIIPHKDGESLLYPHIEAAIRTMARVHSGKFAIYTNGTHFTKAFYDFIRTLPNKFQVLMSFHFQGFESKKADCSVVEAYSCDKGGAALMECLQEPAANVEFIISSHLHKYADRNFLDGWKTQWEAVAAQYPQLSAVHLNPHINPWAGHMEGYGTVSFPECPYGDGGHLFVGVTGNVLPCCMDLNEELGLGNLLDDDLDTILARRERFYADVAIPEKRQARCVTCLSGTDGGCGGYAA